MNVEEIYAEMNKRIEHRLKSDAGLLVLQTRQNDLAKRINNAALAAQKRIETIVAEEFKNTIKKLLP